MSAYWHLDLSDTGKGCEISIFLIAKVNYIKRLLIIYKTLILSILIKIKKGNISKVQIYKKMYKVLNLKKEKFSLSIFNVLIIIEIMYKVNIILYMYFG